MTKRYVIDTNSLIFYFNKIFGEPDKLSAKARLLIERAVSSSESDIKLSIPAVVLVEIFEKWIRTEEFGAKFHYEVFSLISQSPNIEIKPIEREVLENLLKIGAELRNHDLHDKIILASAMMLECPLITTDNKIIEYVRKYHVIPGIIN